MPFSNQVKNQIKSQLQFDNIMQDIMEEFQIKDSRFSFLIRGKVIYSHICKDTKEVVDAFEEGMERDSIMQSGTNYSFVRNAFNGSGDYLLSIQNPQITRIESLQEENEEDLFKYKYAIQRYIYECSHDGENVFYASNSNLVSYLIGYKDFTDEPYISPISIVAGNRTIENSKMLSSELIEGTEVELKITYGINAIQRDRFLLEEIHILDPNYPIEELLSKEEINQMIGDNNQTISTLFAANEKIMQQNGKKIGLYQRDTTYQIQRESRIEIPDNYFNQTIQYESDQEILEKFFQNKNWDYDNTELDDERLNIINSSIHMIDMYKFMLSYMKLPKEIEFQVSKSCYVEWVQIIEALTKQVIDYSRRTCSGKVFLDEKKNEICKCQITGIMGGCINCDIKRASCRYNFTMDQAKELRLSLMKLENPDYIINKKTKTVEDAKANGKVQDASIRNGEKLLDLDNDIYQKLMIAYKVRNFFVHKFKKAFSEEASTNQANTNQANQSEIDNEVEFEINQLALNPNKILDELERACKQYIKELSKKINEVLSTGKCLREEYEKIDVEDVSNKDNNTEKVNNKNANIKENAEEVSEEDRFLNKLLVNDVKYENIIIKMLSCVFDANELYDLNYQSIMDNIRLANQIDIGIDAEKAFYLLSNSMVWGLMLKTNRKYRKELLSLIDALIEDPYTYISNKKLKDKPQLSVYLLNYEEESALILQNILIKYINLGKMHWNEWVAKLQEKGQSFELSYTEEELAELNEDMKKIISNFAYLTMVFSIYDDFFESTRISINENSENLQIVQELI